MTMEEIFSHTFKAIRKRLGEQRAEDRPLWQRRLSAASPFCQSLVACGYMSEPQLQQTVQRYRLGMSRDGGVIFWQIDEHDATRDGKIMYYRPDCHRDHDRNPTWVSYLLKRSGHLPQTFRSEHCLFGLHQLSEKLIVKSEEFLSPSEATERNSQLYTLNSQLRPVAVVESEKTAVIMSAVRPDCVWLATGGKRELNVAKLRPLQGCRVILFPDTDETGDTYREWYEVAQAASDVFGHPVTVSSLLEQCATPSQKAAKIDIADLLFPPQ